MSSTAPAAPLQSFRPRSALPPRTNGERAVEGVAAIVPFAPVAHRAKAAGSVTTSPAFGDLNMGTGEQTRSILIVDDEASVRAVVRATLSVIGDRYLVREAATGVEALASIRAQVPDLVLLDVGLPDYDGFVVCRTLKRTPETARVTVIMLTAMNLPSHRERADQVGADAFMAKPFSPRALLALVHEKLASGREME